MWIVIRHPDLSGAPAICADHALESQQARGWVPCSGPLADRVGINFADYPMPDPEPEPAPGVEAPALAPKTTARKKEAGQ